MTTEITEGLVRGAGRVMFLREADDRLECKTRKLGVEPNTHSIVR
jgi:hypothetical protein